MAFSKMVITAVIVGVGSAVSALGGHEPDPMPQPPVVPQLTTGGDMCAVAASFSGNPVMASEIRKAAGCSGKASASR